MHTLPRWLILFALVVSSAAHADTLADVKDRGQLRCGVNPSLPGFAQSDANGDWHGFDVDLCRAVASAVFGDAGKVKFIPVATEDRFDVLTAGAVDLLARNTSWTLARDLGRGVDFAGVNYFDGQGFLVPRKLGLRSALELDGLRVCVQPGTTSAENLRRYFTRHLMDYTQVSVPSAEASIEAFAAGDCDVITSDQSQLYALRSGLEDPAAAEVLPEIISKEPLGPVVREGDDRWADIVRWSLLVMIAAEEFDVSSRNIERVRSLAKNPELRSLLGLEGDFGAHLGLDNAWAFNIIEQVGNYAESFDRNLGSASPLNIGRGQNALWRDGGLLYAPPLL
jgi:general L-amino acid transport system substrate-binding protein